ncbi:hypothetical protein LP420_05620 [Massilia sp. B-10]|nr:hypothetical protein LP420_05620 [Massilia sp. B-10]
MAHEINNPIGYIFSNFGTLQSYLDQLFEILALYQSAESQTAPDMAARLSAMRASIDLDFLRDDIPVLMSESKEGIARVRHIVQDLKDFSRVDDSQEWVWANLHASRSIPPSTSWPTRSSTRPTSSSTMASCPTSNACPPSSIR